MIEKLAKLLNISPGAVVSTLVILTLVIVGIVIKVKLDTNAGYNSQEKMDIRELVDRLVPEGSKYMAAFAHYTEVRGSARTHIKTYFLYAVAFDPARTDHLWIIPLRYNGGTPVPGNAFLADAQSVAFAESNGYLTTLNLQSKQKLPFILEESNTKLGRECPVNIQQPDESQAFSTFSTAFVQTINDANGVDAKGRKPRTGSWN